jgi:hypothetical protein
MSAGEIWLQASADEALDRLAVELLGWLTIPQQRPAASLHAQGPVGSGQPGWGGQSPERGLAALRLAIAGGAVAPAELRSPPAPATRCSGRPAEAAKLPTATTAIREPRSIDRAPRRPTGSTAERHRRDPEFAVAFQSYIECGSRMAVKDSQPAPRPNNRCRCRNGTGAAAPGHPTVEPSRSIRHQI